MANNKNLTIDAAGNMVYSPPTNKPSTSQQFSNAFNVRENPYGAPTNGTNSYQNNYNNMIAPQNNILGSNQSWFNGLSDSTRNGFNDMGVSPESLGNHQLTPGELDGIYSSMDRNNSLGSMDASKLKTNDLKNEIYQGMIDDNNSFDWSGAINTGLGVANTAMNIGSYFQNQDFNKERLAGMKDNRQYAAAANTRKTNFHNAAKSVWS